MSRNTYTEYERGVIIGSNAKGKRDAEKARAENDRIDQLLLEKRKEWRILPPENMTVMLHQDALVLSVPHEVGRMLLHKRMAAILEHDVAIDAVIEGGLEDAVAAMGMGPTW